MNQNFQNAQISVQICNLTAGYGHKQILRSLHIPNLKSGELVGIIGPNATGKSTFFKSLAGLISARGEVLLHTKRSMQNLLGLPQTQLSQIVGMMPQAYNIQIALNVFDSVLLSLKSRGNWRVSAEDLDRVTKTLQILQISHLSERKIYELSGGQQQMVAIARLLVRNLQMILFDEPTSALDLHHQLRSMQTILNLTRERQMISLIALHDLNLAASFCDRLILIYEGKVALDGTPCEVLSSPKIQEVYRVRLEVTKTKRETLFVDAFLE